MVLASRVLAGSLLLATPLAGCVEEGPAIGPGSAVQNPDDDSGSIAGIVTDDGLNPIANALVVTLDSQVAAEARSEDCGSFILSGLPPGRYTVVAQMIGFDAAARNVQAAAGQTAEVQFILVPVPVRDEPYFERLIGEGYFACGAYILGVVTWRNLHACVWDEHKPRFAFEADRTNLMGVMQEIVWTQNTALTAEKIITSLQYRPVCDPFCSFEESWAGKNGESPIRSYVDLEDWAPDAPEDPVPLASMTFPGGDGPELVIVFQQRITHYITIFYNEHGDLEAYTQIPDQ